MTKSARARMWWVVLAFVGIGVSDFVNRLLLIDGRSTVPTASHHIKLWLTPRFMNGPIYLTDLQYAAHTMLLIVPFLCVFVVLVVERRKRKDAPNSV